MDFDARSLNSFIVKFIVLLPEIVRTMSVSAGGDTLNPLPYGLDVALVLGLALDFAGTATFPHADKRSKRTTAPKMLRDNFILLLLFII